MDVATPTGTDRSLAAPADFGAGARAPFGPPPAVGADTAAVLRGLGMDEQELTRLQSDGVFGGPTAPPPP